jgi:hypothetical protein
MLGSFVDLIMRTFISSKFRQYFILCHPLFSIVQFCIYWTLPLFTSSSHIFCPNIFVSFLSHFYIICKYHWICCFRREYPCHPLFSIVQFCIYCSIYLIIYLDLSFIFQEFKLYWVRFLLICLIFPFRITCSQIYYTLQSFIMQTMKK